MKKLFILMITATVLAGCQRTEWVRPNTSEQQLNADKYACEIEATRMYPNTAGQPIGNPTYSTHCSGFNNSINCTSQQNQQQRSWIDTNAVSRAIMQEKCLMARGYTKQAVKAQQPNQYKGTFNPDADYFKKEKSWGEKGRKRDDEEAVTCKRPDGTFVDYEVSARYCKIMGGSVVSKTNPTSPNSEAYISKKVQGCTLPDGSLEQMIPVMCKHLGGTLQ